MADDIKTIEDDFQVVYQSPGHIYTTGNLPKYLKKVIEELNGLTLAADMNHCKMAVEYQIKQHKKEH